MGTSKTLRAVCDLVGAVVDIKSVSYRVSLRGERGADGRPLMRSLCFHISWCRFRASQGRGGASSEGVKELGLVGEGDAMFGWFWAPQLR